MVVLESKVAILESKVVVLERAIKKLKKLNAKRIFIQYPEGLKPKIQEITKQLEKEGFEAMISIEPTYGACDVREYEAKLSKCDAILHIAHSDFGIKTDLPVVYEDYFYKTNPLPVLEKEFSKLEKFQSIGLVTSLQFVKTVPLVKNFLEEKGKKIFTHKSLQYEGQILGCKLDAALKIENKVDCFLCISAGKFYSLGLVLKTSKPVLNLDLEKGDIQNIDYLKNKIQKVIAWNLESLKEARKIGLVVSWKRGQVKANSPFDLKKKLEKEGKEVYILAADEITPEKLEGLKLDAILNFACPRIGIDDTQRYNIPVINCSEINCSEINYSELREKHLNTATK